MIDLTRVHTRLFEMGQLVAHILDQAGIPYMIAFGTLLGAVRHRGFIPWDDDLDMFMFDDSYDAGVCALREALPSDLLLQDAQSEAQYFHGWAHVRDKLSEIRCSKYPDDGIYSCRGLGVDLYRCKQMRLCELGDYRRMEAELYLKRKHALGLLSAKAHKRRKEELWKQIDFAETAYRKSQEIVLGMLLTTVKQQYMRMEDVYPLKQYQFEKGYFWGPQNGESILRSFYGDYTILPPEEERKPHCEDVIFHEGTS